MEEEEDESEDEDEDEEEDDEVDDDDLLADAVRLASMPAPTRRVKPATQPKLPLTQAPPKRPRGRPAVGKKPPVKATKKPRKHY